MSYDLFFTGKQIAEADFAAHFAKRPGYTFQSGQALYENEDTGVYFSFDYGADEIETEDDEDGVGSFASFNMNYMRPSFFALEAEPEVNAFVTHFGCATYDPQMEGMGEGPYSPEGFIKGWNMGNRFGYSAMMRPEVGAGEIYTKPTAELEVNWQWNFTKEETYEKLGMDIFVPTVLYLLQANTPKSFIVWADAIPTLIPKVDLILVPRKELAPKRFLRGKKQDICKIDPTELDGLLPDYEAGYPLPARNPRTEKLRRTVHDFVRGLAPHKGEINGISADRVLNEEIVEELRAGKE